LAEHAKQEQEPATDAIDDLGCGVLRAQLPINFTGLGHVNMYVLLDRTGAAVVDPGMPRRAAYRAVVDRLRRCGLKVRDVHTVIVTHAHPDHFGGAGRLVEESGAKLLAHRSFHIPWLRGVEPDIVAEDGDLDLLDATAAGLRVPWRAASDRLPPPGFSRDLPAPLRRVAFALMQRLMQPPRPNQAVGDGDPVMLCDREWTVLHTPGHTGDHICLHDPEKGLLLSGDHVLPSITPHISGLHAGVDPLEAYLGALRRVAELPRSTKVFPAHGRPFAGLAERVAAIVTHHQGRLARLEAIADEIGAASVTAYTAELFPARHQGLMAESETFAHLEHLRRRGALTVERTEVPTYRLTSELSRTSRDASSE
jgi:glyoxylase-like metal-dependent hydrolase (beta-lactamase superfamily II)